MPFFSPPVAWVPASVSAFPVIAATNTSASSAAQASPHTVNLPTGIVSGDLLIMVFMLGNTNTITTPTGWTQIFNTLATVRLAAYYRIADGTEGASVSVVIGGSGRSAHCTYRISGYAGTPESGTSTSGSSVSADPPTLSPSWASAKTMWLAVMGVNSATIPTAAPTNYTNLIAYAGASGGVSVGSGRRELETATEDPGAFTNANANWVANVIAIRPA